MKIKRERIFLSEENSPSSDIKSESSYFTKKIKVESLPSTCLNRRSKRIEANRQQRKDPKAETKLLIKEEMKLGIRNLVPKKVSKPRIKIEPKIKREGKACPQHFEEVINGIEYMRRFKTAEVDTDGAETFYDDNLPPHVARFHILLSAMLSSQTKDPVTSAAMKRLIDHGLTVENLLATKESDIGALIRPVGFFNNKAKYIKKTCEILKSNSKDTKNEKGERIIDIPPSYEGLIALPGVGPKMAHLVMSCGWNKTVGICVDTHVHRIANRLGWVKTWNKKTPKSQDPEKTRKELEEWLPQQYWKSINPLLVGFGQEVCRPVNPLCSECSINHLCPAAFKNNYHSKA